MDIMMLSDQSLIKELLLYAPVCLLLGAKTMEKDEMIVQSLNSFRILWEHEWDEIVNSIRKIQHT